jgi:hypothetical protein
MTMNVEAKIRDLKRRVSKIEGSFGFLTQQIKGVHKDLLAFQAKAEQRFDKIDGKKAFSRFARTCPESLPAPCAR